jgi:hypothetical protein
MLDKHLAELYAVEIKVLNQAVKRNIERFPDGFRFQLTESESEELRHQITNSEIVDSLRSQFVTLKNQRGQHRKYYPYVFTEQGVAMLSAVLRSEAAVKTSIHIIQAFVQMRRFIADNAGVFHRLENMEHKQFEADEKFEPVFQALEQKETKPEKGIFFDGEVFDAYRFVSNLVRSANKSIVLIDNYIDDTVLTLFLKRKQGVKLTIYTKAISKQLAQDVAKFNIQYEPIQVKELKEAHD